MKKLLLIITLCFGQYALAEDIYRLKTTIGSNVFNDLMVLETSTSGSITVPGVFTAPMLNVVQKFTWGVIYYKFDIIVRENNEQYLVTYSLGESYDTGLVTGSITKDGKQIGIVKGSRIYRVYP